MITLEQLAALDAEFKSFKAEVKKYHRLNDKVFNMGLDVPRKRRDNALNDLNWAAMALDKQQHRMHVVVVRSGLAERFSEDYYGEKEYNPSAWHKYTHILERP